MANKASFDGIDFSAVDDDRFRVAQDWVFRIPKTKSQIDTIALYLPTDRMAYHVGDTILLTYLHYPPQRFTVLKVEPYGIYSNVTLAPTIPYAGE